MSGRRQKKTAYEKIAAIETTCPYMSLALYDGLTQVSEYRLHAQRAHSEKLVSTLSWIIQESGWEQGPDALAVDVGPGSFTGIRVGLSMARALAQGWNIPLAGVPSLDVLAEGAGAWQGIICCIIDALRDEVFEARYQTVNTTKKISHYRLIGIRTLLASLRRDAGQILFVGSGASVHRHTITEVFKTEAHIAPEHICFPYASGVARIAGRKLQRMRASSFEDVHPFYMRRPAAEERLPANKKSSLPAHNRHMKRSLKNSF